MPLPYAGAGGIPCYHNASFVQYSVALQGLFYDLVRRCQERRIREPEEPLAGSYSAVAPYAEHMRAAKLVMYENGTGEWVGRRPPHPFWVNGLYVWVRANDEPGDLLEKAIRDPVFFTRHEAVLSRLHRDGGNYRVVSVDPKPLEHFAYFQFESDRDVPDRIVDLIEACSRLGAP